MPKQSYSLTVNPGEEDRGGIELRADLLAALPASGRFRGDPADCQLDATNDLEAVSAWLKERARRSPATFESYRIEAERLLLWAAYRGVALSGLSRTDMADYDSFLRDPQPVEKWVLPRNDRGQQPRVPRTHPNWRPFAGPLAASSREKAFNVLRALFSYLHATGYLRLNVLAKNKLGKEDRTDDAERLRQRYLSEPLWQHLLKNVAEQPQESPKERLRVLRTLWVLRLVYETGARRGEIAEAKLTDITQDAHGNFWLLLHGKGSKDRSVPISADLYKLGLSYRAATGLSPSPTPAAGEPLELVLNLAGKNGLTDEMLWRIVRDACHQTASAIEENDPSGALKLRQASTHWLRHSRASHLVQSASITSVQKFLGHESLETTGLYQHIDQDQLHREIVGSCPKPVG